MPVILDDNKASYPYLLASVPDCLLIDVTHGHVILTTFFFQYLQTRLTMILLFHFQIHLRHKLARLLGYSNYADYAVEPRMAKTPAKVCDILYGP